MSNTYIQRGDRIDYVNGTTAVSSGDTVVIRTGATGMIGVAVDDIAASGTGAVEITGVQKITKATTTALGILALGDIAYWDIAGGHINSQASANIKAGIITTAAAAADTTANVLLIPSKA